MINQNDLAVSFHVSTQCVSCELKFFTEHPSRPQNGACATDKISQNVKILTLHIDFRLILTKC